MKLQEHNLSTTHYLNGDPIRHAQSNEDWVEAGGRGEGAYCISPTGGYLYNWYAVNDLRGIGRVPTDAQWESVLNTESLRGCDGFRTKNGSFYGQGFLAAFWSSSEISSVLAWYRSLRFDYSDLHRYRNNKRFGFSVRCLEE